MSEFYVGSCSFFYLNKKILLLRNASVLFCILEKISKIESYSPMLSVLKQILLQIAIFVTAFISIYVSVEHHIIHVDSFIAFSLGLQSYLIFRSASKKVGHHLFSSFEPTSIELVFFICSLFNTYFQLQC